MEKENQMKISNLRKQFSILEIAKINIKYNVFLSIIISIILIILNLLLLERQI